MISGIIHQPFILGNKIIMRINLKNLNKKRRSFFFITSTILIFFSCKNANLNIIVPDGYVGAVCLIKSTVDTNELRVDSNGIGYITEKTFDNLFYKPSVFSFSGKDLSVNCVDYNPSTFWALGVAKSLKSKRVIHFMSFEIVPDSLIGKKQYYDVNLFEVVDTTKIER